MIRGFTIFFLVFVLVVYAGWKITDHERQIRRSEIAQYAVQVAFSNWKRENGWLDQRPCQLDLCRFVDRNGLPSGNGGTIVLGTTGKAAKCPYTWWPWSKCLGLQTTSEIFENDTAREIIRRGMATPCEGLLKIKMGHPPHPLYWKAREFFGCRASAPSSNFGSIHLWVWGNGGSYAVRFNDTQAQILLE